MFWIKIIICILIFIAVGIVRSKVDVDDIVLSKKQIIYIVTFIVVVITLIITYIPIHFTIFTIPKLILFFSICLCIWRWPIEETFEIAFALGFSVTFVAYIIAIIIYIINVTECEPDIEVVNTPIIPITIENSSECYILYEQSAYKYCYLHEDGASEISYIPVNGTSVYYIKGNEKPHIESTIKTKYSCYKGDRNNYNWADEDEKEITYKLYIPEKNSIKYSYYEKEQNE